MLIILLHLVVVELVVVFNSGGISRAVSSDC
jgi:hypothetical protein